MPRHTPDHLGKKNMKTITNEAKCESFQLLMFTKHTFKKVEVCLFSLFHNHKNNHFWTRHYSGPNNELETIQKTFDHWWMCLVTLRAPASLLNFKWHPITGLTFTLHKHKLTELDTHHYLVNMTLRYCFHLTIILGLALFHL